MEEEIMIQTDKYEETKGDEANRENEESHESFTVLHNLYDDDLSGSAEFQYAAKYENEWTVEYGGEIAESVSSGAIDWEKQAKETVHLITEPVTERRITIYDLDSYAHGPSAAGLEIIESKELLSKPQKEIRYSTSLGAPGIARINLSPLTQKVIGCVIGENVSTEYPWVYVKKETIEDNVDLHKDSSDFLPIKDEIHKFPDKHILIGYVPSITEEGQFYICLTPEGRDMIIEHIQKKREEHENRVRTAIYKPLGQWEELGSGIEIDAAIVKNTRPLLEIEVVGTADVLYTVIQLEDRDANDIRDGYVELLPYRQIYAIIPRKVMQTAVQVTPLVRDAEIQTVLSIPLNTWVQYQYTYQLPNIGSFNEEQLEDLRNFLHRFTDKVCDILLLNATVDIYTNDYENLVKNIRDTQWPIPVSYEEHLSFQDEKHVIDKVINDLCWHPLWSGIAFAAYTSYAKSQYLVGPKSDKVDIRDYSDNFVLAWSFNNTLTPKLVLECPKEVTSVAINPLDGNLVVGGCSNGQLSIVIWHISGKITSVEIVRVHTAAELKHRTAIANLVMWMQKPVGVSRVAPTAMSSLKDSHKAAVTQIIWMSPYDTMDTSGTLKTLPENTAIDDLSSQFITASEDGTIAFWNLKIADKLKVYQSKSRQKSTSQTKRPEALTKSTSPFKILDHILKPYYMLEVRHPNENRKTVITTMTIRVPKFKKERIDTFPYTEDLTIRRIFKNIVEKPSIVMQPFIHIGTLEGDFGCITWEGYDFGTDVTVNTEVCTWSWHKKVHDAPITHSVRSTVDGTLIATIGGKIFAIWKENLGIPIIWKKRDVKLTALSWDNFGPSVLIMTRMDGSVELWDFMVKSDGPCITQSLSGRIITGIYTHELISVPQCVGFCDFNGILRMFLAPSTFLKTDSTIIEWLKNFIDRQVKRVQNLKSWQDMWMETKYEDIKEQHILAKETEKRKQMDEQEIAAAKPMDAQPIVEAEKGRMKPWKMIEYAREEWKTRELKHMQEVILEKKGLKKDDLERQREPILKLKQEAKKKKQRLKEATQMQETFFTITKSLFFPKKTSESKKSVQITFGKAEDLVAVRDAILSQEVQDVQTVDPNEEIIYHFMETQTRVLDDLNKNPFVHSFHWRTVLMAGKARRDSMINHSGKLSKTKKKVSLIL